MKTKTKWESSRDRYEYMELNTWKIVIRAMKKQCNVSSRMNYLQFAFKDPKFARNKVSEMLKKLSRCFSHTKYFAESLESQWSVPASEICL